MLSFCLVPIHVVLIASGLGFGALIGTLVAQLAARRIGR